VESSKGLRSSSATGFVAQRTAWLALPGSGGPFWPAPSASCRPTLDRDNSPPSPCQDCGLCRGTSLKAKHVAMPLHGGKRVHFYRNVEIATSQPLFTRSSQAGR
jgi:hypothetical protein